MDNPGNAQGRGLLGCCHCHSRARQAIWCVVDTVVSCHHRVMFLSCYPHCLTCPSAGLAPRLCAEAILTGERTFLEGLDHELELFRQLASSDQARHRTRQGDWREHQHDNLYIDAHTHTHARATHTHTNQLMDGRQFAVVVSFDSIPLTLYVLGSVENILSFGL